MGRGATKREGGHMTFYPYEKGGGGRQSFSHAEGDAQHVLDSFHTVACFSHIEGGVHPPRYQ